MGLFSGILGTVGNLILPGVGTAIGGIAGGLIDANNAEKGVQQTNELNSAEAQKQRDWQTEMSNTAYRRATEDMKQAGLNPMLGYTQGGAAQPGAGQIPTMQNKIAASQEIAITGAQVGKLQADTRVANSQAALNGVLAEKAAQDTLTGAATAQNIYASTEQIRQNIPKIAAETTKAIEQAGLAKDQATGARAQAELAKKQGHLVDAQRDLKYLEQDLAKGKIPLQEAQTRLTKIRATLEANAIPRSENDAEVERSSVGTAAAYTRAISGSITGAAGAAASIRKIIP